MNAPHLQFALYFFTTTSMLRATVISCLGPERSQGSAAHSVQLSSPSDCQQPPTPTRRPELDVAYVQNWSLGCVTEALVDIKTETMCRSTVIKWTTGSKPAALCRLYCETLFKRNKTIKNMLTFILGGRSTVVGWNVLLQTRPISSLVNNFQHFILVFMEFFAIVI